MKSLIKIAFFAVITVIVIIVLAKANFNSVIKKPNSENSEKVTLQIEQGESVDSIINKLVNAGILKENWKNHFKYYLKINKLSQKIQAGVYEIPKNLNIKEIVETIQQAKGLDIWVIIPEGLRKDEIADTLAIELGKGGNNNFNSSDFLKLTTNPSFIQSLGFNYELTDLEGFLFPDKYAFSVDEKTEDILKKLINNFKTKVGTSDSYEDIIIASMVEREGYNAQDRAMIADIIQRRYKEGWLLQIDATLLYPVKDWKHTITQEDKNSNNLYNTYKYAGLPLTPICNPGLESINAVRNPQSNSYYYYIHDKEGNIYYAKNLAGHNENIKKYLNN